MLPLEKRAARLASLSCSLTAAPEPLRRFFFVNNEESLGRDASFDGGEAARGGGEALSEGEAASAGETDSGPEWNRERRDEGDGAPEPPEGNESPATKGNVPP